MATADDWFHNGMSQLERSRGADSISEYERELTNAVDDFDRALELDPDHFGALRERGLTLARIDRHDEALESFWRAARLKSEDAGLQLAAAKSLLAVRQYDRAVSSFELVLKLRAGDDEATFGRAQALTALERN